MVFDLANGRHWRPAEGGLPFGMSNPGEPPGEATAIDEADPDLMRRRLADLVPVTAGPGLRKGMGGHDRLRARPPANQRPGADAGGTAAQRHHRERRRPRHDVGSGSGQGRR